MDSSSTCIFIKIPNVAGHAKTYLRWWGIYVKYPRESIIPPGIVMIHTWKVLSLMDMRHTTVDCVHASAEAADWPCNAGLRKISHFPSGSELKYML